MISDYLDKTKNPKIVKLIEDIVGGCGNETATIWGAGQALSFVQVYTADEGVHKFHGSNIAGILALLIDRREGKVLYILN
jgi:hypothetical protein